ncbi:transcription factor bHLH67-like isoform X1 [Gossypium australe]|uniref:Transcription factor bHLH67-like isoform X1 n=1 Tax=Gossypium australe TaxID=47621 RepID=A0A5B6W1T3_9ROSI|nr:transcription factor bHLH67-like isoform X1 [Gossypium australe]
MLVTERGTQKKKKKEFKAFTSTTARLFMERLQGPINPYDFVFLIAFHLFSNPVSRLKMETAFTLKMLAFNASYFLGEHLEVECLEQGFISCERLKLGEEEEEAHFSIPSFEEKMPFLQMLQSVESPQLFAFKEPNFQTLLRLQHMKKPWELNNNPFIPEMETQVQALELESCVTHETELDLHSPVKSETKELKKSPPSSSCVEVLSSGSNQHQPKSDNRSREPNLGSSPQKIFTKSPPITRERRKRKRTKAAKNKEEVESQRMTHIAVERNRRRQMNDYLNSLRSLMPPCYIQRGDQASIIAGAIDFVKELEQLLQSLEAQKRTRKVEESNNSMSKPATEIHQQEYENGSEDGHCREEVKKAESKTGAAEVEVNVIHNHVNLKIQCSRRAGQLIEAIVTLETLRLTVLHLNITTSQASVLYSFNLKMEDDSALRSADEIAAAAAGLIPEEKVEWKRADQEKKLLECGVNRGPASQHALPWAWWRFRKVWGFIKVENLLYKSESHDYTLANDAALFILTLGMYRKVSKTNSFKLRKDVIGRTRMAGWMGLYILQVFDKIPSLTHY